MQVLYKITLLMNVGNDVFLLYASKYFMFYLN